MLWKSALPGTIPHALRRELGETNIVIKSVREASGEHNALFFSARYARARLAVEEFCRLRYSMFASSEYPMLS